jgi:hypothetical protein
MAQCNATRKDGQPCGAEAQVGRAVCFFHDPDRSGDRKDAQSRGGSAKNTLQVVRPWRGREGEVTVIKSPTTEEIVSLIADTIDEVKVGAIDPKIANAVGYLSGVLLKALEYDALNERLQAIEEAIGMNAKGVR